MGELGVDIVLECTGFFASKEKASAHVKVVLRKLLYQLQLEMIFQLYFIM
jgi:glyceraldehyde-3-phosphate dehydrogenase/erythrose-4-phosphate dehydrogenase